MSCQNSAAAVFDEKFCRETVPEPILFILAGASGDLAARKIFPALSALKRAGLFHRESRIIALSRRFSSLSQLKAASGFDDILDDVVTHFNFDIAVSGAAAELAAFLDRCELSCGKAGRIYYFALPYTAFPDMLKAFAGAGLFEEKPSRPFCNLVLEKPLGGNRAESNRLHRLLRSSLKEHQIYFMDHYLGKDDVQNILMMRFANILFSEIWNSSCIDSIIIGTQEVSGISGRAAYFDRAGIINDMFQSHLLLMLGYCLMEKPLNTNFYSLNCALENALRYVTFDKLLFVGQYDGYLQEKQIMANSRTPTCADVLLKNNAKNWNRVKIRLFAGKRFACDRSFIRINFKSRQLPFMPEGIRLPGNSIELELKPASGIHLKICTKQPGPHLCIGNLTFSNTISGVQPSDGYRRLLLDCQNCDRTLFPGFAVLSETSRICDDITEHISGKTLTIYPGRSLDFSHPEEYFR